MADRGPDWQRPWGMSALLWNSAAVAYYPLRLYLRMGDWLLFHAWLKSRPVVWWLAERLNAVAE